MEQKWSTDPPVKTTDNISETFHSATTGDIPEDNTTLPVICMLSVFSVVGTFGNSIVLHVFLRRKDKVSSTIFILSLAGIDCITCLIIIPFTVIMEYINYGIQYEALCKIYIFLITFNVPLSSFVMVAIAFDRYFCICHSLRNIMNRRKAKIIIIVLIVFAACLGTITSLMHAVYTLKENRGAYFNDSSFPADCFIDNSTEPYTIVCKGYYEYDYEINASPDEHGLQTTSQQSLRNAFSSIMNTTKNIITFTNTGTDTTFYYTGFCQPSEILLSRRFRYIYQKIYAFLFLADFCIVLVLYVLIYRFLVTRRIRRHKSRSLRRLTSFNANEEEADTTETRFLADMPRPSPVVVAAAAAVAAASSSSSSIRRVAMRHKVPPRERLLMANVRTAAMLFVVTVVFIVVFLPAWLTAMQLLPANKIIFNSYFLYNVVNPFIYAFMNPMFKKELQKMLSFRKQVIRPRCLWYTDVPASC
ncbi:uncharacterized protein LOC115218041 [Octopus sinensis]|uniref:Uncharacterized protein LOC115218041 n=1 Tax=Octopus sinensis TaxID=2607531 RepID=A0A6P7SZQ7_9MOLL|nr:uncharacterized protein LOC115218041 [Octopus sinensis]XP_036363701.1 uncharacterized protein LOC115218041 [Octopus sinensis]XP_036363702.1 uncharacterized protein LOC115218041 [Octopus sinensis]XP_036363703.1 uncharacterized protein LOC115218041 [Octopus sinensis]